MRDSDTNQPGTRWLRRLLVTAIAATAATLLIGVVAEPAAAARGGSDRPGVFRSATWFLSNGFDGSTAHQFVWGLSTDKPVAGDWNADGGDSPGLFRNGEWYMNHAFDGGSDFSFTWGQQGDIPVVGDWNNDGIDTPGVFRGGYWFLNDGFDSSTEYSFTWAQTGDVPVVGDWDGNGTDTPGIFRGGTWYFNNGLDSSTEFSLLYGDPGDVPVVGDWDGNGTDTPAVFRNGTWWINNGFDGSADFSVPYGTGGDIPVSGDWDGTGGGGGDGCQEPVCLFDNDAGGDAATFRNDDGTWTIWKRCTGTVGPGYVGRLVSGGKTILNDNLGAPGGLNAGRGGLGTFGVHYTRGRGPGEGYYALEGWPFVYELSGRTCSNGSSPGVYQVDRRDGPIVRSGVGHYDLTVWIRDQWGRTSAGPDSDSDGIGDAGIRIDYEIRVYRSVVKQWATVTNYFAHNFEGYPFAKEPKFTGSLPNSQAEYTRIAIFGGIDGMTFIKAFGQDKPIGGLHSGENNRLRVRYDFATSGLGTAPHGCNGTIKPCLNVVFKAVNPATGASTFWEQAAGSNFGLDKWATDVAGSSEPRVNREDQPNANQNNGLPNSWNCNATSDTTAPFDTPEESTSYTSVRRWEFGGDNAGPNFSKYSRIMTLATGWEGGRGGFDCESTYRVFPSRTYKVEMRYSVDSGWE